MFDFTTKMVPIKYVKIDNNEINAKSLHDVLETFIDDDDINDYDIPNLIITDILVKNGILEKRPGDRMATLISKTDKFYEFYSHYIDEYYKE